MLTSSVILVIYVGYKALYSWDKFILEIGGVFGRVLTIMLLFSILKKMIEIYTERTAQKNTPFAHWMLLGVLITWFW